MNAVTATWLICRFSRADLIEMFTDLLANTSAGSLERMNSIVVIIDLGLN